jgi:hypothetical protein
MIKEQRGVFAANSEQNNQQSTANSQQPTANSQQPTANSQQPTANSQQLTANSQQPTANGQQTTANDMMTKFRKHRKLASDIQIRHWGQTEFREISLQFYLNRLELPKSLGRSHFPIQNYQIMILVALFTHYLRIKQRKRSQLLTTDFLEKA